MAPNYPRAASLYYTEIARMPLVIDPVEEKQYLRRWQQDQDVKARDAVVQTHLRFVVKMARKRTKDPEAVRDYIAAGNLGLLKAADKFDWTRKPYIRFLTYAGWWIYEEMSNQDYTTSTLVHVPAHRQKAQRRNARAFRAALQEHGPENAGVQTMDPGRSESIVMPITSARYASNPDTDEHGGSYGATRLRALVRAGIDRLPAREQTVLNLYYGVKDDARNLVQIAAMMSMCPERVRQIKNNGMQLLQTELKTRIGLSVEDAYL
jgi:RNA polymerase primary sigma factor